MIQYADAIADATNGLPEPYVITSSNDQFSVVIDGGSTQTITLTHGTRTAANIVSDLSTLTGCTASVCSQNGINYVRVRTTSSNGATSTILFNAPTNNSNTILGFTATTYTGGQIVAYTFLGDTKQDLASGIEDGLNSAGWITVSGHHSSSIVCQSSCTPASQNLRMQVKITTANSNTVCVSLQNVSGSHVGGNGTGSGALLLPAAGKGFKIYANKYQAFVTVQGSTQCRDFGAWGVPYIPTWLQGMVWEAMWLHGNSASDTDTDVRRFSFRTALACSVWNAVTNSPCFQHLCNGNLIDSGSSSSNSGGWQTLCATHSALYAMSAQSPGESLWHDLSAVMGDPLIGWGLTSISDAAYWRGQLWNSFVSNDAYPCETAISSLDSHSWVAITHNNASGGGNTNNGCKGTVFVTTS